MSKRKRYENDNYAMKEIRSRKITCLRAKLFGIFVFEYYTVHL